MISPIRRAWLASLGTVIAGVGGVAGDQPHSTRMAVSFGWLVWGVAGRIFWLDRSYGQLSGQP